MELFDINSLALSSSPGETAPKAPRTYRDELNCLAAGQELEGQLSPRQKCWRSPVFLC